MSKHNKAAKTDVSDIKRLNTAHVGKCAVLFLLSGFWLLMTLNSAYDTFYNDIFLISPLVGLICVFQILFLLMIRVKFSEWMCNVFFALFAVVNISCLYLFFIIAFVSLPPLTQAAILIVAILVAHQFFASLSSGGWWTKSVIGIVSILFFINIAWLVFSLYLTAEGSTTRIKDTESKVEIVNFRQKPNVYFISFDALLPASLAKKFLQTDNFAPLDFILENGFYQFKNAFSDGSGTIFSLNQLLAMDPDYFQLLVKQGRHWGLFTGMTPSPALEIFKANGYITNTYFRDQYMGHQVGPYVNNHKVAYRINYFSFCRNHLAVNASIFGFFGYCLISESERVRNFIFNINISDMEKLGAFQYVDFVLKDFSRQLSIGKPFVSFMHIISPDHAPLTLNENQLDEYRKQVIQTLDDETPRLMEKIFNFIQANDPKAFIYFYADHGQWLSQWIASTEFQELNKEDREFYIQDRYGILAAFYPPNVCAEYFNAPMMKPFVTNTKVLRQVIRCLAGGDDPIPTPVEYRLWPYEDGYQGDERGYYEDYLYE